MIKSKMSLNQSVTKAVNEVINNFIQKIASKYDLDPAEILAEWNCTSNTGVKTTATARFYTTHFTHARTPLNYFATVYISRDASPHRQSKTLSAHPAFLTLHQCEKNYIYI